ncbi:uncharacterized protein [Aegilops tauschii subsp. strangulata]|uniref:uncharacterized protein n=1 Tax=Aegilops tauschii subsp. strangulata TaxID=200361 RepID=UPI003CC8DDEE
MATAVDSGRGVLSDMTSMESWTSDPVGGTTSDTVGELLAVLAQRQSTEEENAVPSPWLNEDGGHTFLKCKKAKECWNILALGETREKLMLCNSAHSMLQELWRCDEDTQLKAVTFMWEWWNVHNKANAGEAAPKPQAVCHWVERLLIESLGLRKLNKPPKPSDIHRWSKPPVHHVKVNFDGAFDENTCAEGWGYLVRDQVGKFIAAGVGKTVNLKCALQSEFVACLAAIDGAIRIGENRIIFDPELAKLGVHSGSDDSFWEDSAPNYIVKLLASDIAVLEV